MSDTEKGGVWRFEVGDELVKEDSGVCISGAGAIADTEKVYTVERRLEDADGDRRYYHVEWEEEAPPDSMSDTNVRRMLKSASMVHSGYRLVDDSSEGSDTASTEM